MPSIQDLLRYGAPLAGQITGAVLGRRATGGAQRRLTGGIDRARDLITTGSTNAMGAIQGAYNDQRETLNPFIQTGLDALPRLSQPATPFQRDPNFAFSTEDLYKDPGYQFRQSEGQKVIRRDSNADLNRFSGATIKAMLGFNQDLASQEYDKAYRRSEGTFGQNYARDENTFRDNEADAYGRVRDAVDIGQTAAGQQVNAAGNFGASMAQTQRYTAAQLADLETERANAEAVGDVEKSNQISRLIETGVNTALPFLTGASLAGGGTLAGIAGGAVPSIALGATGGATAGTAGLAALGASTPGVTTGAAAAGGGGLGSTIAGLATNPITIGVAGALIAGTALIKSQAHWEANTVVNERENPFHQKSLAPFAAEWDRAVKSGTLTPDKGQALREQYVKNWDEYVAGARQWGRKGDKKKVADQSIMNLWTKVILPQVQRMDREILMLGAA